MTTEEILAAAHAEKKPADEANAFSNAAAKTDGDQPTPAAPRKQLDAADILAIANGKLSIRREQPVSADPLAEKTLPDPGDATPAALPEPITKKQLTAADIRDLGGRR